MNETAETFGATVILTIPSGGVRIKKPYKVAGTLVRFSKRYKKWLFVEDGFKSDGATKAIDIHTAGWIYHDKLCETGCWADGTTCTNWEASWVLVDELNQDGYDVRKWYWFWFTWLFGGGECRKNGMLPTTLSKFFK